MSATAATVVTLQAEVRVLMMGARQVTKGVFAQLDEYDECHLANIDVMGRVSVITPKNAWPQYFWLGRAKWDGSLVKVKVHDYNKYMEEHLIVLAG